MNQSNEILDYYIDNATKIFNSIQDSKFRIWKIVDEDGKVRQNPFMISTPEKLLKFIKSAKNPQKLYVSISTFLNPHRNHGFFANQRQGNDYYFYPRAGYIYADCILLDSFFFIDLDSEEDLRIAQEDARKIIKLLGKPDMLQFSGTKGIHLGYDEPRIEEANPIVRIKRRKEYKDRLVNILKTIELKTLDPHHWNILKDVFRVYAAPYSLKGLSIVQPLDYNQFMNKDIYSLISKSTRAKKINECGAGAIEARSTDYPITDSANDSKVALAKDEPLATEQYSGVQRDGLSSPHTHFKFVDIMVKGLKDNYITVIKKHKRDSINLRKLQRLYKLSDFYIVSIGNYRYYINFKCNQLKRQIKILRAAKSKNLNFIIGRKHYPLQISPTYKEDNSILSELKFEGIIKSDYGRMDNHSASHQEIFKYDYPNLVGEKANIGVINCIGDFNG